jgi:uncharacterized membrane protein YdjX (TVP38/TMEM64 family)
VPHQPTATAERGKALKSATWRVVALATVLATVAAVALVAPLPDIAAVQDWIRSAGAAAPLLYLSGYVAGALLFVPRPLLTIAGGLLFGAVLGTALAVLGATIAALISFLVARAVGRDLLTARSGRARLAKVDDLLRRRGWLAVAYLRLLPMIPFAVVNYGCGLTSLPISHFVVGTAVGSLPGTALLVVAGGSLTNPTSPAFFVPVTIAAVTGLIGLLLSRRRRPGLWSASGRPSDGALSR